MSDGLVLEGLDSPGRFRGIDLHVPPGTVTVVVGPSGSGKSSLLGAVAGLLPATGAVRVDGADVSGLRPQERPTATVAQEPALFPHLSVEGNVGFGLDDASMSETARRDRVRIALADLGLLGLKNLHPEQLSGGQRQRAALARALVVRSRVLLLDEPLSHLDASRHQIQREVLAQVRRHAMSCLYVTHDIEEACQAADTLVVLHDGTVRQVGPPRDVVERPTTRTVAQTMGVPNSFACAVTRVDEPWRTITLAPGQEHRVAGDAPEGPAMVSILPDAVGLRVCAQQSPTADHSRHGQIIRALYSRSHMLYDVETTFGTVVVRSSAEPLAPSTWVELDLHKAWVTQGKET